MLNRRRIINWSGAMHEARSRRFTGTRPVLNLPLRLVKADGTFNRRDIMRRAHALAARSRLVSPNASWRSLFAQALSHAWWEAKMARPASLAA
jgi:hypothetical protein